MSAIWESFHVYYHGDRKRPVLHFVRPVVASLLAAGRIDSFFYILYPLGGPQLRLRLRLAPARRVEVAERLIGTAAAFLDTWPSTSSLSPSAILASNRRILAGAPKERDARVYPDNSFRFAPYEPEVERYGGAYLHELNRELFAVSSVEAIHFLVSNADLPAARRMPFLLRLLTRQAFALATDPNELLALLACRVGDDSASEAVAKADRVFSQRRTALLDLVRGELETLAMPPRPGGEAEDDTFLAAARQLARDLRPLDRKVSWRIKSSQIHMTGNRVGLSTADEAYAGRLLWLTGCELAGADPDFWRRLAAHLHDRSSEPQARWCDLRRAALMRLAADVPEQDFERTLKRA